MDEVDSLQTAQRLSKIMALSNSGSLGTVSKSDGSMTKNSLKTLEPMRKCHFSQSEIGDEGGGYGLLERVEPREDISRKIFSLKLLGGPLILLSLISLPAQMVSFRHYCRRV